MFNKEFLTEFWRLFHIAKYDTLLQLLSCPVAGAVEYTDCFSTEG